MKKLMILLITVAAIFPGCNKSESPDGAGRLSVVVTDDPFNFSYVESATVTIRKIEIRQVGDSLKHPFIVLTDTPVTVDLVKLRNGLTKQLADLEIPAGTYDLVRIYVDETSMMIRDHSEPFSMKVPGGMQTGIKVFITPALHVEGGLTSELLLDFDLSKSFVMRGNMSHAAGVNGFIFKPCIRAANNTMAGRIEGFVADSALVPVANAKIALLRDSVIATAIADTLGHYAFLGVPAGSYSMFATKENYDTVYASAVRVVEGNRTVKDFIISAN